MKQSKSRTLKNQAGTMFYRRTLDNMAQDLVTFVALLGLGRHYHACHFQEVMKYLRRMNRYKGAPDEEIIELIRACDFRHYGRWHIEIDGDVIIIK